jgi:2,5-dihydroxypyridine 5,6-dioxygenase
MTPDRIEGKWIDLFAEVFARWEALVMYDRADVNGTEQRAFAGNVLYSTGANEVAGRHTLGHFDLPFRRCTVELDGEAVVREGKLAT